MHKIQEMKNNCFNKIEEQLNEQTSITEMINNMPNHPVPLKDGLIAMMGDPSYLHSLNNVISNNFSVAENILTQQQQYLAKINSTVAHNSSILQNLKSKVSDANSNFSETNSKTKEVQQKIQEATRHQQLKQQEYNSIQNSKTQLINNMNPKQMSFILQKSIEQRDEDTINLLINKNFDPNFQNATQNSLLHTVIKYNHQTFLQKIITKNPNVNLVDKDGNSALHISIQNNDLDTLRKLMIAGLNINLAGKDGNTLLHCAAAKNNLSIVKYLLEECPYKNAINVNLKNNLDKSCADLASLRAVKNYLTPLVINSVTEIEHDNPILNHPKILKDAVERCNESIIGKLIDLGKQFMNNEEDKELLENICRNDNNLENLLTLLGIDLQQESTQ